MAIHEGEKMRGRYFICIIAWLIMLIACGPSDEEKAKVAADIYQQYQSQVQGIRERITKYFNQVQAWDANGFGDKFDLKTKPAVDINSYPRNGVVLLDRRELDGLFSRFDSMKGSFEIHRKDSLEDVRRDAKNVVNDLLEIRYIVLVKVISMSDPKTGKIQEYTKKKISLAFVPGEAKAKVAVFDLSDGQYLGHESLLVQNSLEVKLRPTDIVEQLKQDLLNKLREAAITQIQYWDEVNRKKKQIP